MSKPTLTANWCTDQVHWTAPIPAHKLSGYSSGEDPSADEWNAQLNIIGQWVSWLDGIWGADGSLTLDPGAHLALGATGDLKHAFSYRQALNLGINANPIAGVPSYEAVLTSSQSWVQEIDCVKTGDLIGVVRAKIVDGNAPTRYILKFYKSTIGASDATLIASSAASSGSGAAQFLSITVGQAVADGDKFWLVLQKDSGSTQSAKLYTMDVAWSRP